MIQTPPPPHTAPPLDARTEAVLHRVGETLSAGAVGLAVAGTVGAAVALASGLTVVAPLAALVGLVVGSASRLRPRRPAPLSGRRAAGEEDEQRDAFYGGMRDPELARAIRALGMSPDLITRDEARNLVDIHTHMAEREHRQPA